MKKILLELAVGLYPKLEKLLAGAFENRIS